MVIQIVFPIVYCIVAIGATILYCIGIPRQRRVYEVLIPGRYFSWYDEDRNPRTRVLLIVGASALIIVDFISLAVLNYNCFYWVKIMLTLFIVFIVVTPVTKEENIGIIPLLAFIGALVALYVGTLVSVRTETIETTTRIASLGDSSEVEGYGSGLRIVIKEHQCFYFYTEVDENQFVLDSVPSENTTIHYIRGTNDGVPRVIQERQVRFIGFERYGEQKRFRERTEHISAEIYIPEGSIVESYTLDGP